MKEKFACLCVHIRHAWFTPGYLAGFDTPGGAFALYLLAFVNFGYYNVDEAALMAALLA